MKTAIEPAAEPRFEVRRPALAGAALRKAANRLALAAVALALAAIFTTICVGVALAAALLSMG